MFISEPKTLRHFLRIFFCLGCALLLFSAFGITTHAARSTGTVKNPILNVRTEASTGSAIRCKLSKGVKVTILSETTGTDGMKWYNVYFSKNNEALEGYVRADLILVANTSGSSSSGGGNSSSTTASSNLKAIRPNAAIVRSTPSTSASIQTRLYKGTIISVISEQTSTDNRKWAKVTYMESGASKEGYIRSDLLTTAPTGAVMTGTTNSSSSSSTSGSTKKSINTNVALVRTYASTNGDIRTRLVRDTLVTVLKTVTGPDDQRTWYKVSYTNNGVSGEGYIRGDLLSEVSTTTNTSSNTSGSIGKTAYVQPLVVNIRSYASTSGDIRSKLSQGAAVTILSEKKGDGNQTWYKISYTVNGAKLEGYIRGDLIRFTTDSENTSGSNSSNSNSSNSGNSNSSAPGVATVYSYASPNADVRTTLPNGTKVSILKEVTGEDGEKWCKIRFEVDNERVEGYVKSSVLK